MINLASEQPGYFQIILGRGGWYFECNCPCGCGQRIIVPVDMKGEAQHGQGSHRWGWDGNLEAPTLTPSLKQMNGCKVHFNLNAGVYTVHSDGAPAAPNVYRAP
jgi:hypothetical protein